MDPARLGWAHLITRCATLLTVHVAFTIAVFLSIYYSYSSPFLYGALCWEAIADNAVILLIITKFRNGIGGFAIFAFLWEVLGLVGLLAAYQNTQSAASGDRMWWTYEGRDWEQRKFYVRAFWLVVILGLVLRSAAVLVCLIDSRKTLLRLAARRRV
ncbi:hypothetical protein K458DRAFT_433806 [Lentithecium fluviatile CBS 122367]|uniref:Uncharacterized protein n=1 Tax=Lentithecium fluviatile CBS 122367 TaxID=1168545 RepID=A0A6G1IT47_9PLEO|nr:hypothetical protein K458DRAFT_433806 [Lentithecium fluviatile CBS 122367]